MKYKLIGLSAVIFVMVAVSMISFSVPDDIKIRYIEHIMAEEKQVCSVHPESKLCTHLPIVKINTEGIEIPGKPIYDEKNNVIDYTLASDGTTTIEASLDVISLKQRGSG